MKLPWKQFHQARERYSYFKIKMINAAGKYLQIQGVHMGTLQSWLSILIQILLCFVFKAQLPSLLSVELIPGVKLELLKNGEHKTDWLGKVWFE